MERIVERIIPAIPSQPKVIRVAAYARVSSGKDAMLHSLSAQVSYYSKTIQEHPGWLYCGVYSDEAISGTKEEREGFRQMYTDCKAGRIDMVITKSVSRFARNTVTLLETVRELKLLGVDIYFEEQNIHTMSADGELMLTLLASFAQEESLSVSENMKWRVKKNFEEGKPWNGTMLGYRYENGVYIVVPKEAAVVRKIFESYLAGMGTIAIVKMLNAQNIATRNGNVWGKTAVMKILRNYSYTGNLLLQKTYRENYLTKRACTNHGQLPMYHAIETHEAIIPLEMFESAQEEMNKRRIKYAAEKAGKHTSFTGIIACSLCGKNYRRKTTATGIVWICNTFNTYGKGKCASKQIPENTLIKCTAEIMGMAEFDPISFEKLIERIEALNGNVLIYHFKDRTKKEIRWKDRSRSESWTPEMREAARKKAIKHTKEELRWQGQ